MQANTQYSRLNPFGTGENLFRMNDDSMEFDDPKAIKKDDVLKFYFIDPLTVENRKYYLLEQNIDGEFVYSLRFAKVENGLVEFVFLNPEFNEDKIQLRIIDLPNVYTGIAQVVSYDRWS